MLLLWEFSWKKKRFSACYSCGAGVIAGWGSAEAWILAVSISALPGAQEPTGDFSAAALFPQKGPLLTNHLLPAMICISFKKLIKKVSNK